MSKKYQIFLSSTFSDLTGERDAIVAAITGLGHFPVNMESFGAEYQTPWQVIEDKLSNSDYYILVLGDKYGTLDSDGVSFTEKEYDLAQRLRLPTIVYLRANEAIQALPFEARESLHREQLDRFRKRIAVHHFERWNHKMDLVPRVYEGLTRLIVRYPRDGWIKSNATSLAVFDTVEAKAAQGASVSDWIDRSKKTIAISGMTLTYLAKHLKKKIQAALERGVTVSIIIVDCDAEVAKHYALYRHDASLYENDFRKSYSLYDNFYRSLPEDRRARFTVYLCSALITHSIGLYDDYISLNPFTIDGDASPCPYVQLSDKTESFGTFVKELKVLSKHSRLLVDGMVDNLDRL